MTLTDLDQIRVLADPLRVRMLEAFCLEPRTTKQVAETLGEKPTKLYHHVDALEKVGLIRLVRTQPNRGTLEKYYQSAARKFRAAPTLFESGGEGAEPGGEQPLIEVVEQLIDRSKGELLELVASAEGSAELLSKGMLTFAEIQASPEELEQIQTRLEGLLEELTADTADKPPEGARSYRLLLAYYPLVSSGD